MGGARAGMDREAFLRVFSDVQVSNDEEARELEFFFCLVCCWIFAVCIACTPSSSVYGTAVITALTALSSCAC